MNKKLFYFAAVVLVSAVLSYSYMVSNPQSNNNQDAAFEEKLAALRAKQKRAADKAASSRPNEGIGNLQQLAQNALNILQPGKTSTEANDPSSQTVYPDSPDSSSNPFVIPEVIEPTPKSVANLEARSSVGNSDPFAPISAKPFPRVKQEPLPRQIAGEPLPPPPGFNKGSTEAPSSAPPDFELPPPPPGEGLPAFPGSGPEPPLTALDNEELPSPPDKPSQIDHFDLSGIVGNRAILKFFRDDNKVKYVTLAEGETFNNVHLIEIKDDSVVLEEDGARRDVEIPAVR